MVDQRYPPIIVLWELTVNPPKEISKGQEILTKEFMNSSCVVTNYTQYFPAKCARGHFLLDTSSVVGGFTSLLLGRRCERPFARKVSSTRRHSIGRDLSLTLRLAEVIRNRLVVRWAGFDTDLSAIAAGSC